MLSAKSSWPSPIDYRIGHAWSCDGLRWTKFPFNPIFVPGPNGASDAGIIFGNAVFGTAPYRYNT